MRPPFTYHPQPDGSYIVKDADGRILFANEPDDNMAPGHELAKLIVEWSKSYVRKDKPK